MNPIAVSLCLYIVVIFAIGYIAYNKTKNLSDFVLGGRRFSGPTIALGAGAADMSAFLMMSIPGAILAFGFSKIWIAVGLSIGAFLNWTIVAKRLRVYTEVLNDSLTIPSYLHYRFHDNSGLVRFIVSIVVIFFFTLYAASGFVAAAKLLQATFDLNYTTGLIVGALIIITYTLLGGFLALNWIDVFQGTMMFLALIIVPIIAINNLDGFSAVNSKVSSISPSHLNFFHDISKMSMISLLSWGLGYFGQLHILVRFMAIKKPSHMPIAISICMSWMVLSLLGAALTGLAGFVYFHNTPNFDAESVFLVLSKNLFNPWIAGLLVAAVLSATMSTVAAQLIASSSSAAEDIYHGMFKRRDNQKHLVLVGRITVTLIAIIAIYLASNPNSSILDKVSHAWAGLGASLGPTILISLYWPRMTRNGALAGMAIGALTVIIWPGLKNYHEIFSVYEILPGFIFASLAIFIVSLKDKKPEKLIYDNFKKAKANLNTK